MWGVQKKRKASAYVYLNFIRTKELARKSLYLLPRFLSLLISLKREKYSSTTTAFFFFNDFRITNTTTPSLANIFPTTKACLLFLSLVVSGEISISSSRALWLWAAKNNLIAQVELLKCLPASSSSFFGKANLISHHVWSTRSVLCWLFESFVWMSSNKKKKFNCCFVSLLIQFDLKHASEQMSSLARDF